MKKLFWAIIIILLPVLLVYSAANAQTLQPTPSDDEVNEIARQLNCPICGNIALDVCNAEVCRMWREEIRQQLADGKSEDEILSYFMDQYGSQVLADPSKARWLFNITPILIFLSGFAVIIWVYRTRKVNLPLPVLHSNFDSEINGGENL